MHMRLGKGRAKDMVPHVAARVTVPVGSPAGPVCEKDPHPSCIVTKHLNAVALVRGSNPRWPAPIVSHNFMSLNNIRKTL